VLNRGIDRRTIFKSSNCYSHFLELLSQLPKRFGVRIHGYVLMADHYHLQIETPQANLSRAIQCAVGGKPGLCGTHEPATQGRSARTNRPARHWSQAFFVEANYRGSQCGLGSRVADTFHGTRQRSAFRGTLYSSTPFGPHVTRIGPIGRRHGVSRRDHGHSTPGATIEVRQRPCQENAACLGAVASWL
jgi:REP element-mobilizing transposase RayT